MQALTSDQIRGTWGTLLLPIDSTDRIDMGALDAEIDALIAAGVAGIYSNGTAGEFHNQSEREFASINELLASKCEAASMPFQIGASHMAPQCALERVRVAAALKPGAIQVILPDWTPMSNTEVARFLQHAAALASPAGLVLYNPPHAKRVLTPTDFGELARQVDGLVGVKVIDGDAAWYAQMQAHAGRLSLFVPGHHLATGMRHGATGAYSNIACLHPAGAVRWNTLMHRDPDAAVALQTRICNFFEDHIMPFGKAGYSDAALDKLMGTIGNWAPLGPRLRWPYDWIDRAHAERLRPIARAALPELLA